jgi:hypothetical protein
MLIENINISSGDLALQSGIVSDIASQSITKDSFSVNYIPRSVVISNNSGGTIEYTLMTDAEYTAYSGDVTVTDFIQLYNEETDVVNNLRGNITRSIVKGVAGGSYSSGIVLNIAKTS